MSIDNKLAMGGSGILIYKLVYTNKMLAKAHLPILLTWQSSPLRMAARNFHSSHPMISINENIS